MHTFFNTAQRLILATILLGKSQQSLLSAGIPTVCQVNMKPPCALTACAVDIDSLIL